MMELHLTTLARPRRLARSPEPETIPAKKCRSCKREKSLTAFATHPMAHDGRRRDCRCCVRAGRPKRQIRPKHTEQRRRARKKNPALQARNRIAVANWTKRNPIAHKARHIVSAALKRGDLKKAPRCSAKGCARQKVEAHHPDYRKPLDVLWACRPHHRRIHAGEAIPLKAHVDRKLARIPRELAA